VIYTSQHPPTLLPGEARLIKRPIKVRAEKQKLPESARVNFGKFYTVEYNIKVALIGYVDPFSLPLFRVYSMDAVDAGYSHPPLRTYSREIDNVDYYQRRLTTYPKGTKSDHSPQRDQTTLQKALDCHNPEAVRNILMNRFDYIATGEYSWLRELDEVGYTRDEIAELLLEDANDAPWIYFEPGEFSHVEIKPGIHLSGCVHQSNFSDLSISDRTLLPSGSSRLAREKGIRRAVQELCGIAGVVPVSRDAGKWNGRVKFEEQNSVSIVSYVFPADEDNPDRSRILSRVVSALRRFCIAAGQVQQAGLCCDCFTILGRAAEGLHIGRAEPPQVELWRINFDLAVKLFKVVNSLLVLDAPTRDATVTRWIIATPILEQILPRRTGTFHSIDHILHSCSLAAQFLCLGFLSYCQAHIGSIQPFFLDNPQRKILLQGSQTSQAYGHITAELADLTCVGNMTRKPVLTFCSSRTLSVSAIGDKIRYDLLTSTEDLLDTWGPGHYVMCRHEKEMLGAISVGGGIISAVDKDRNRFHWSQCVGDDALVPITFDPRAKIVIGAIVAVNQGCVIDEMKCWKNSLAAMEYLGPYEARWQFNEQAAGFQAGQYLLGQYNRTWHKIPGRTLKRSRLEEEDDLLIPFLECTWGLQVSFCTSVSRRIPLRELVADVLPIFANTFLQHKLWDDLKTKHNIIDAFQGNNLQVWLSGLASELQGYVLKLIRRILVILEHTGVDCEGKYLSIAWPQEGDVYRCFKIPCEKRSFWARILADSEDCATFAYVSSKCLETDKVKCSGPSPVWRNVSALLETAVIHHQSIPAMTPGNLEHEKTYFFKKLDSLFLVRVHRPNIMGIASLNVLPTMTPRRIQQRLFMREQWKREGRLRERQADYECGEQVLIC
jgi:hypothetical protein